MFRLRDVRSSRHSAYRFSMPDGPEIDRHPWRNLLCRASVPENPVITAECQEHLTSLRSHIRTGMLPDSGWIYKNVMKYEYFKAGIFQSN